MADQAVEPKVFQFPDNVRNAYEQLQEVQRDLKKGKSREDKLKTFLSKSIPLNDKDNEGRPCGFKDGVKVTQYLKVSTSWKKAFDTVKEKLVPSTKRYAANEIVYENTKESTYPKFADMNEDDL